MLDPDAEDHAPASLTIPEITVRHEGIPLRGVDDGGELVGGKVPGSGTDAGDVGSRLDLQAPHVAEIPGLHHGQDGALEDNLLEHVAQPHIVAPVRRGRDPQEQLFPVALHEAQRLEDFCVGGGCGMMGLVADQEPEAALPESVRVPHGRLHGGDADIRPEPGALLGLEDADVGLRVDEADLLPCL